MKTKEPQIFEAILSGDEKVYKHMYTFYYNHLFNYGRKLTNDLLLIEDAIQESFIAIWKLKVKSHEIHSPKSYLFTTFRHFIFNEILKEQKLVQTHLHDSLSQQISFSKEDLIINEEHDKQIKKRLETAISKLTDRQREIIFLRFYENMSYEEASAVMDITTKGAYKLMARAILDLKKHVDLSSGIILVLLKLHFS